LVHPVGTDTTGLRPVVSDLNRLGEQAFGVGESTHAAWVDDADFELAQQKRRDDRTLILRTLLSKEARWRSVN